MAELAMGPNPLWLAEFLTEGMALKPGMKVLDLGCGKAATSVFFAKEFGVEVWASDLWIDAAANEQRIADEGMSGQIHAVHAEAHSLRFEKDFFDAVVSLDAYHYFGNSETYIGYISQFLKRGSQIGIVVPGLTGEMEDDPPKHLQPYWYWDFWTFHSPEWWRRHWDRSGKVSVEIADMLPDGWKYWREWNDFCNASNVAPSTESEMLALDAGKTFGFTRCIATRHETIDQERWLTFSPD